MVNVNKSVNITNKKCQVNGCYQRADYKVKWIELIPNEELICDYHKEEVDKGISLGVSEWRHEVLARI